MKKLALVLGIVIAASANAKTAPKETNEPYDFKVISDRYFLSEQCGKYLDGFTLMEKSVLMSAADSLSADDIITYVSGRDSVLEQFQKIFDSNGINFNASLVEARAKLKGQRFQANYTDEKYTPKKSNQALSNYMAIAKTHATKEQAENPQNYMLCEILTVAAGKGALANYHEKYVAYALSRVSKARIGYFEVSVDKGVYGKKLGTGNQFAEPKQWNDSRFFTVYASFKNLDTESRLPVEGSLFINYNGKEYEFDSVEPIMVEGYNIWFRKINPLITMKTKIVYRVPNEVHGEVFWRPGRNPNDIKLLVGTINAAK
jgi:hypothetical protein